MQGKLSDGGARLLWEQDMVAVIFYVRTGAPRDGRPDVRRIVAMTILLTGEQRWLGDSSRWLSPLISKGESLVTIGQRGLVGFELVCAYALRCRALPKGNFNRRRNSCWSS